MSSELRWLLLPGSTTHFFSVSVLLQAQSMSNFRVVRRYDDDFSLGMQGTGSQGGGGGGAAAGGGLAASWLPGRAGWFGSRLPATPLIQTLCCVPPRGSL